MITAASPPGARHAGSTVIEECPQVVELAVHRDPQGLKDLRRRVGVAAGPL